MKPTQTDYPKHEKWRFAQRSLTDEELIEFANTIVEFDESTVYNNLPDLLRFLPLTRFDIYYLKKHQWLKIWVNIMHQMGLGYTSGHDGDTYIHATDLAKFLVSTGNIRAYYYYWALKFQYPFSYPKNKHYIENGVTIQPIVLILQYLIELFNKNEDINDSFLTKYEIAQFLMKSKDHFPELIQQNCSNITNNRVLNYQYENEILIPGFKEAADHLFSRGRLFIRNIDIITFDTNSVRLSDVNSVRKAEKWLSYCTAPILFQYNDRDIRNEFFLKSYSNLVINPEILVENVDNLIGLDSEQIIEGTEERERQRQIFNPPNTTGTFSNRMGFQRRFQTGLRRDLLQLYDEKCCICGLDIKEFLITSHIVPVNIDRSIASDRKNCILLCSLHDRAFENGYISLKNDCSIIVNPKHIEILTHPIFVTEILNREGEIINLPTDSNFRPMQGYLERHRHLHNISDNE